MTPTASALQQEGGVNANTCVSIVRSQRDENGLNRFKKQNKTKHENQVIAKFFYFPIVLGPTHLRPLSSEDAIIRMLT